MDDDEAAAVATAEIQAFATQTLRRRLPYLKSQILADIVSKGTQTFQDELSSSKPAMAASRKRISFMSLSAELRNRIYELELEPRTVPILSQTEDRRVYNNCSNQSAPPLTQVSRQVRSETLPIYYANTTFEIRINREPGHPRNTSIVHETARFLDVIGAQAAGMIKHLHIKAKYPRFIAKDGVRSEEDFRGICHKALGFAQAGVAESACTIEFSHRHVWIRDDGNSEFFEDGKFLYRVSAEGHVTFN